MEIIALPEGTRVRVVGTLSEKTTIIPEVGEFVEITEKVINIKSFEIIDFRIYRNEEYGFEIKHHIASRIFNSPIFEFDETNILASMHISDIPNSMEWNPQGSPKPRHTKLFFIRIYSEPYDTYI